MNERTVKLYIRIKLHTCKITNIYLKFTLKVADSSRKSSEVILMLQLSNQKMALLNAFQVSHLAMRHNR